ncbi:exported hypothetical protein [Paraburkholderia sabiae]|uniref:hypothetical protein n=1 Tax=Paraburkholderia sabiae TaxID=273251 RepID=UPI001CAC14B6|nr:hypothetical protein [Paraburkholderia sabiae]CAG9213287.1 exported hypothetical protein [Paraburkholderia sabiae]
MLMIFSNVAAWLYARMLSILSPAYVADSCLGAPLPGAGRGDVQRGTRQARWWRRAARAVGRRLPGGVQQGVSHAEYGQGMSCMQVVMKPLGLSAALKQTSSAANPRVVPVPGSRVPETDAGTTAVTGRLRRAVRYAHLTDTHFIVMATSKHRPDVLPQSIQAVCPMECVRVGSWPSNHSRGTRAHEDDVEERFKAALCLPAGMLSVCRNRTDEALRLFMEAPGIINLASAVYVPVHQGEESVAIEIIRALLAARLHLERLHIVCCADDLVTDVNSFQELQAFLRENPRLSARVHAKAIPGCAVLSQITRTPASIGDLLFGTQDFAQDVKDERSKSAFNSATYKALDGLFLQYRLAALRPVLLDALEGLTPGHLTSEHWYERIYADPLFLGKPAKWDGKPVGFDSGF